MAAPNLSEASTKYTEMGSPRKAAHLNPFYGRFVGVAKVLLPTLAAALIVMVALWPQLREQENRFAIGPANIDATDAESLRMVNARYTGVDRHRRPFAVTADTAAQISADDQRVNLSSPKADILLDSDTWVALTATTGTYDREQQILELGGIVNLFHDSGYEFRTTAAVLDLAAGDAMGTEPVEGQGPFGRVTAEGFRISDRGARIHLLGKTHLVLKPQDGGGS